MDLFDRFHKTKEWLNGQWWYVANHHLIVFILSGIASYFFVYVGREANAHWVTFIGGMILMAGLFKLKEHYFGKDN